MNQKLFRKVILWEKPPIISNLLGGFFFLIAGALIFGFYFDGETIMEMIFGGMAIFGLSLIEKGIGKGKRVFYRKC